MSGLAKAKLNSWSSLVLYAGTTPDKTAADLLPRLTSLQVLPAALMVEVEGLVATLKAAFLKAMPPEAEVENKDQASDSTVGCLQHYQHWQLHCGKAFVAYGDAQVSSSSKGLAPTPARAM